MKKKEIILATSEEKLEKVKETIRSIRLNNPKIPFSAPVPGRIGDIMILTLKVAIDYHDELLVKIYSNGLKLFREEAPVNTNLPKDQQEPERQFLKGKEINVTDQGKVFDKKLDDYVREGNYRAVIKISKDVKSDRNIAAKAQKLIKPLLEEVISYLNAQSIMKNYFAEEGINKLLKIASDQVLQTNGYFHQMKSAALHAINLCGIYDNNIYKLIDVANSTTMPQEICIKAAAKLGKITLSDQGKFVIELAQAEKRLNYRWLETIFEGVANSISDDEIRDYEKLKRHIKRVRG